MTREEVLNLIEKRALSGFLHNPGITWEEVVNVIATATEDEKTKFIDAVNRKDSGMIVNLWNEKLNQMIKIKAKSVRDEWDNNPAISIEDLGSIL
jgi:hypothetical protein